MSRGAAAWSIALCLASACKVYDAKLVQHSELGQSAPDASVASPNHAGAPAQGTAGEGMPQSPPSPTADAGAASMPAESGTEPTASAGASAPITPPSDTATTPIACGTGSCWWSKPNASGCDSAGRPSPTDRPDAQHDASGETGDLYFGWTKLRLGETDAAGMTSDSAWQNLGLDLDGTCTNASSCPSARDVQSCKAASPQIPFDGALCRDNRFGSMQAVLAGIPEIGTRFGFSEANFNCNLWRGSYNVVIKLSNYNGAADDSDVRVDWYMSTGLEQLPPWSCPGDNVSNTYPLWKVESAWQIDRTELTGTITTPGTLPASSIADAHAYVRGGYLVATLPDAATLRLASPSTTARAFTLQALHGVWLGELQRAQDGTWQMHDGLLAGRVKTSDLQTTFRRLGLCANTTPNGFDQLVTQAITDNADLLGNGQVDASQACDAVSIGLGFEASQLTPGAASSAPMSVECCTPGTELEDCNPRCGDGRLNGDELCDTAIATRDEGACPRSCASTDACAPQVLTGSDCHVKCTATPITAVGPQDGCCPKGANGAQDADCPSVCGNGVVEPNESCDPAGSCPSCQSDDKCWKYAPTGSAETCDLRCNRTRISECVGGDGCCANGCNSTNDSDCSPSCGNGVIEGNETCEQGSDKPCPTSCDDGDPCTEDAAIGGADTCNADCTHTDISAAKNDDACCPSGANANNDSDCKATCGNKTTEPGEECDDGNDTAGDGCEHCKNESPEQVCTSRFMVGSAACTSCDCGKCPDQLQACYGAANPDDAKACSDLVACELANHCNGIDCYCGGASLQLCVLPGLANGPCRAQVESASKSSKANDVFDRVSDAKYPAGLASALTTCMNSNCDADCSPQ